MGKSREIYTQARGLHWLWQLGGTLVCLIIIALIGLGLFRLMFVKFVDNYELGYAYDARTGQIEVLEHSGYYITTPLRSVYTVDMRPMQICMNANARVMNCKLVKFNPKGLSTLLEWHGRNNYDGGDASSTSSSDSKKTGGGSDGNLAEILKSYAFENKGKTYPFLTIIDPPEEEHASTPTQ